MEDRYKCSQRKKSNRPEKRKEPSRSQKKKRMVGEKNIGADQPVSTEKRPGANQKKNQPQ